MALTLSLSCWVFWTLGWNQNHEHTFSTFSFPTRWRWYIFIALAWEWVEKNYFPLKNCRMVYQISLAIGWFPFWVKMWWWNKKETIKKWTMIFTSALVPLMDSRRLHKVSLHWAPLCNECQTLKCLSCLKGWSEEDENERSQSEVLVQHLCNKKTAPFVQPRVALSLRAKSPTQKYCWRERLLWG